MPTFLHQLIAVQRGVDEETRKQIGIVQHLLTVGGDQDPLQGLSRTYDANADGDELPPESRRVQITAAELITRLSEALRRLFDLKYTREEGNCNARANVVVDGQTLLSDVPVGYLMFLEAQLGMIAETIETIPTLNPAEEWDNTAPGLPEGVWATPPRRKGLPRRVPQVQILWEPNREQIAAGYSQPAQVRPYETERIVGYWTTVKYSGQMEPKVVQEMRARALRALEAVRKAREQANRLEVTDHDASPVLRYVFGELSRPAAASAAPKVKR